jgi:hypothetical protein
MPIFGLASPYHPIDEEPAEADAVASHLELNDSGVIYAYFLPVDPIRSPANAAQPARHLRQSPSSRIGSAAIATNRRRRFGQNRFRLDGRLRFNGSSHLSNQWPTVLIELVNKEHANHVQSIWHDPTNDFGRSVVPPNSKQ